MYKATLSLAILAVARLALAQPYCLLTAVNKFEHPADQKALCCKEANKVKSYLEELCPSSMQSDAKDAFKTACEQAGFDDCSKDQSSSSSSSGSSTKKSHASSAPYPVAYTTTYFDVECGCTKTTTTSSTSLSGPTGFTTGSAPVATGTSPSSPGGNGGNGGSGSNGGAGSPGSGAGAAGPGATGSPISPAGPSGTGSSSTPNAFTGAASKNVGSVAAGLLAVAGIAVVL